ncbi:MULTISPECIES: gluconokinase [Chitinophagaceae]
MSQAKCIIVMGVSGSGKTTIGKFLAKKVHAVFVDGDDLHPTCNIQKMSQGIPLNDTDRLPWLHKVGEVAMQHIGQGQTIIIACSALKRAYRDLLRSAIHPIHFIYLDGSFEQILKQMSQRKGHFMPEVLLKSQLATLEIPTEEEKDVVSVKIGRGEKERVVDLAYSWQYPSAS